ncbi:hypothetical protein QBC44DRAFT_43726 [Cladorrhinum sp. PSN332]|nr:hypothetical protein QBC44DRAFT_43726 [Cladorrhinum sp. PSN332]
MPFFPGLPAEIVDEILDQICPECNKGEFHEHSFCEHPAETFASLCLTSKLLNEFATKRLYRRPNARKWWLLGRTLITRPDLAELVKDLYLDTDDIAGPGPGDIGQELHAWCLERRNPAIHLPVAASDKKDDEPNFDDPWSIPHDNAETIYGMSSNAAIDIIAGLCPNPVTLHSTPWYSDAFTFCKPQSLLSLKHIKILRADTEGDMDIAELRRLFRAAPNLETMHFVDAGSNSWDSTPARHSSVGDIKLEKATEVLFEYSGVGPLGFRTLLGFLPNVEKIRYGYCGNHYEQFTPHELLEIIGDGSLMKNVKEFSFVYDGDGWHDAGWNDLTLEMVEQAFTARGIKFLPPPEPQPVPTLGIPEPPSQTHILMGLPAYFDV